jgi:hypothetical protein
MFEGTERSDRERIPKEWLVDLAASGAICDVCAGIHLPNIETAIVALTAQRESDFDVPYCSCEGCKVCEGFRVAVEAMAQSPSLTRELP